MDLKTWLDAERGRYTELAKQLDVTVGRISQMADDGVPPKFMLQVRDFTGGNVTLEEMVKARTPDSPDRHLRERTSDKPARA
jgi:hypothetical protein